MEEEAAVKVYNSKLGPEFVPGPINGVPLSELGVHLAVLGSEYEKRVERNLRCGTLDNGYKDGMIANQNLCVLISVGVLARCAEVEKICMNAGRMLRQGKETLVKTAA